MKLSKSTADLENPLQLASATPKIDDNRVSIKGAAVNCGGCNDVTNRRKFDRALEIWSTTNADGWFKSMLNFALFCSKLVRLNSNDHYIMT
ncbi:hypothetical protein CCACVL1_24308 [Corchorus capsularis]|uniref:Uncharacterized protein n=1 Tax=Corchorus capsularis TaxID=210143 RepID=A0A1R3GQA6_COCAP|nr:hypothetical protein CCACVL1_24308 [Corchorus capsularis]